MWSAKKNGYFLPSWNSLHTQGRAGLWQHIQDASAQTERLLFPLPLTLFSIPAFLGLSKGRAGGIVK